MKILFDTQLILWAAGHPDKLSSRARAALEDPLTQPLFSAASIWEVAIKRNLGREDFQVDPRLLRRGLLDNGYEELPIMSDHAIDAGALPALHKDPFDRMLVAQSRRDGILLMTTDPLVSAYEGPIEHV